MQLTLDPSDLKPKYQRILNEGTDMQSVDQSISTSGVSFDKLNEKAQQAVLVVGRGTFYSWNKQTYNAIYPPA